MIFDGVSLIETPYLKRRKKLENIIVETDRLKLAKKVIIDNSKQLDQHMDDAVEKGCEGLVLKSLSEDSIYRAGSRGFLWVKYKREYKSEMADSVDLVAVGAFAGFGRRAGTYGALLMASYDKKTDSFYTVCKLGSGFNDDTLSKLPEIFEPYVKENIHPRVNSKIKADYWFSPSLVLEVIGSELTVSPSHTCGLDLFKEGSGLAIRFPRFSGKWRKDKSLEDSTSVDEIIEMYKLQLKRIK
jgi:DNA ligase-1